MAGPAKQTFGRRGAQAKTTAAPATTKSTHVIYRDGETARPTFHNSHAELHWPKYGGALAAIFVLGYLIYSNRYDPFPMVIVPLLFGVAIYFSLNKLRKAANDIHSLRTEAFRSPIFLAGAAAGLLYYLYSTFISPEMIVGLEWGGPKPRLEDGWQRQDLSASAIQLIKALGMMAFGGWLFQFVAKRFRRAGEESEDAR